VLSGGFTADEALPRRRSRAGPFSLRRVVRAGVRGIRELRNLIQSTAPVSDEPAVT